MARTQEQVEEDYYRMVALGTPPAQCSPEFVGTVADFRGFGEATLKLTSATPSMRYYIDGHEVSEPEFVKRGGSSGSLADNYRVPSASPAHPVFGQVPGGWIAAWKRTSYNEPLVPEKAWELVRGEDVRKISDAYPGMPWCAVMVQYSQSHWDDGFFMDGTPAEVSRLIAEAQGD